MKEKLYAIPVNDAFNNSDVKCECPICKMYKTLEDDSITYTMGPSYMEDDIRAITDEKGFCDKHMEMIYTSGNKLGISLIMKTHFDKVINNTTNLPLEGTARKGFFSKESTSLSKSPMVEYLSKVNHSCFVCDRIDNVFMRYIDTIFYLWKTDSSFKDNYAKCNGFCNRHFEILANEAVNHLKGEELTEFYDITKKLYISNMERVRDDLAWFIDKFDYRNADAPWKNSKDAIIRAMTKTNSKIVDE